MTGTERKQHFKTTLVALLTASVLTVTALAGCGGGDNKDAEKSAVTGTEIVTSVVESVYLDDKGNPVTDPSGNPIPVSVWLPMAILPILPGQSIRCRNPRARLINSCKLPTPLVDSISICVIV